jgi:exosortase/archaeosortase family protein
MVVENFIAFIVSALLSITGVSANAEGCIIYVPSLNQRFIVALPCVNLAGMFLAAFMYIFVTWVYFSFKGRSLSWRTYLVLGFVSSIVFFFVNILRIFTEIYLLAKVYSSVYTYYLFNWQSFEEQIGISLMFATLLVLSFSSWTILKKWMDGRMFY